MNCFKFDFNYFTRLFEGVTVSGIVCLAFLTGCSGRVGDPVDAHVAQKVLALAMENWKDGKSPKDLLARSPSVFVQEAEWNDVTQLLGYEIINDEQLAGPSLIATVKLKLKDNGGKVIEKTATYIVGTSPSLVVYRNLMK